MKPVRTLSGVTTVTVLTKPYPCPGKCIFCPTENQMPKSYLKDEPGAARAFQNRFDPFEQVSSRITEYNAVGHPTDKIECLILGGTWSSYRRDYQEWFIRRCFDAMNGNEASPGEEPSDHASGAPDLKKLHAAQIINETTAHRNVGLVIETRPDEISADELVWLRQLGVTKVQMGAQSLNDRVLELNQRGHTAADTLHATTLLRAAGFKIVLHWMPNLLGATPASDRADFSRLWQEGYAPDEIKIYPTQLLESAELYQYWQRGEYTPYTTEELIQLVADLKTTIPRYCRVNRIIRDIPSIHVVEGNRRTSLRQDALAELSRRGQRCQCIRCREVRNERWMWLHFTWTTWFITRPGRKNTSSRLSPPMTVLPATCGSHCPRWMRRILACRTWKEQRSFEKCMSTGNRCRLALSKAAQRSMWGSVRG